MKPLVVAASVALKWVLVEPASAQAEAVLFSPLVAPDWWRVEVANGLWKAFDRDEIDLDEARKPRGVGVTPRAGWIAELNNPYR